MNEASVKLSLAMIARNEERCIERCLKSVDSVVDEIVLIDTGSTDKTPQLAKALGAHVLSFDWCDDFSAARNFALDHASGDWVLVLDADEQASPALRQEIREFIQGPKAVGRLRVISDFRRGDHVLRSTSYVSRLFPRGCRFEGRIHEQVVSSLPRANLKGELWHDGYLQAGKSDRNVTLLRRELEHRPGDAYLLFQLAVEYTSLGKPGDAVVCLKEAYERLRRDEPFAPNVIVDYLYALSGTKQFETGVRLIESAGAVVDDFPDYHLACGLFYMNLIRSNAAKYVSYLPRIEQSFKRALSLGETEKYKSVSGSGSFLALYNLGTLYQVFGDAAGAQRCFEQAAALGYEPAAEAVRRQKAQGTQRQT